MTDKTRVLILGGGFGGLYAALQFEKRRDPRFEVTVVNRENFFLFTPMLHEIAASDLDLTNIVNPVRKMIRRVNFFCGDVDKIDIDKKQVVVSHGFDRHSHTLEYDHLVLALGSVTNFFNLPGVAERALTMKSLGDAIQLRNRLIAHLEEADTECARGERPPLLTFVVAGGGFAGVETIASINDFLRDALPFYPNLKEEMLRLVLVHPGEYILPELGEKLGRYADRKLRERGVEIRAKSKVAGVRPNEIELSDGEKILSSTLVWTAGISPNPILDRVPCEKERGRVRVNSNLKVEGVDGLWALGDCALVPDPATGKYCPPTAQHASREGKVVARNIIATIYGRPKTPFSFKTLGALAAIGRRTGVARILGINFSGFLAWFLWRGIYWSKLPRTEKKVRVAIDWALDVLFTKDFVQFLDQRALVHTQTETGAAPWNREHLSVAGSVDAGNGAIASTEKPGSPPPGYNGRVRTCRFSRPICMSSTITTEHQRLEHEAARTKNWKRWGPYLSERQWATVREDYSPYGNCWDYFPHDHARSRAYRWGEDGLLGISDRQCRLCFALALWNANDPILKERLFGLTGSEGNHGEDVKELYYYLDSTPTHSYMKALYKYPQAEYPYSRLIEENRQRGLGAPELELIDTGVLDEDRYFDVFAEYAKASEDDILIRLTIANRGPEKATLHLLPTLWFRNTWSWGPIPEESTNKPSITLERDSLVRTQHDVLGNYQLAFEGKATPLFTENETNSARIHNHANGQQFVKDAFHEYVVHGRNDAVNPQNIGTKFAAHYLLEIEPGKSEVVRLRLSAVPGGDDAGSAVVSAVPSGFSKGERTSEEPGSPPPATATPPATDPFAGFEEVFALRMKEADEFYAEMIPSETDDEAKKVARQGYAGLLWSKQFYNYCIREWLSGDPAQPAPPPERHSGRNREWTHLFNRDVISMPDKWEYPWFAAWDLAFHMIPFSKIDPDFAKKQLMLFLREWFMHPNGQIPAYEFAFGDVNPPVHAWAAWRVYKMTGPRGKRDTAFLESVFQKLLLNFTWWVNRKDAEGNNLFSGGFLGLDNVGVFDRSKPLPTGGFLQQADGTAWMGFYCLTMLSMALELAQTNPIYEDMASKFFEHFIGITDAMNSLGGTGLWDEQDGFYYDQLKVDGQMIPLRTRSVVGLLPLIAVENLETEKINKLPGFKKRMEWFLNYRKDLASLVTYCEVCPSTGNRMLAVPTRERLRRALGYMLDENEFLSQHGLRSVSRVHRDNPYIFRAGNEEFRVDYVPGEGNSYLFGGNSNWRGPIWFPINFLIVEALERYHLFYGDSFKVECPTGSGNMMTLQEVSRELARRLGSIFLPNEKGARPCHGDMARYADDPHWRDLVLFYEYFHGETGRGCGASHQTGWTALAVKLLENTVQTDSVVAPKALWSAKRPRVAFIDVAVASP